jgi:hypothetical protein
MGLNITVRLPVDMHAVVQWKSGSLSVVRNYGTTSAVTNITAI